jgi:hypothetical protein
MRALCIHSPSKTDHTIADSTKCSIPMYASGSVMASVAFALVHETIRNDKTSGVGIFGVGDSRVWRVGRVQLKILITLG